jgi:hypothetical protein
MRHATLLFVLVPLYLIVVGALVIAQMPRQDAKPVVVEDKAPVAGKPHDAGPQAVGSIGRRGLTPDCEKELRRTSDLLRFFANRIQTGEDTQSVVTDMRQQEKKYRPFASSHGNTMTPDLSRRSLRITPRLLRDLPRRGFLIPTPRLRRDNAWQPRAKWNRKPCSNFYAGSVG